MATNDVPPTVLPVKEAEPVVMVTVNTLPEGFTPAAVLCYSAARTVAQRGA